MSFRLPSIIVSVVVRVLAIFTVVLTVLIGVGLGLSLAETTNIKNQENFFDLAPALPTKILEIGRAHV